MISRIKIYIRGAVQGVGFRPFIYKLAIDFNLNGFVYNSTKGVFIEAEGIRSDIDKFLSKIEKDKPVNSYITGMEFWYLDPVGYNEFHIETSKHDSGNNTVILPDIATCKDCIGEMNDPEDRRYRYPFINCTNCGPRFSIIESLPYDRPNTSMKKFKMCGDCLKEYNNPLDRRFHAQPIACPRCGPQIKYFDLSQNKTVSGDEALCRTITKITEGKIIALKGLGGYQLIADATNNDTVMELRRRKQREEKPFALMFPSPEMIKMCCKVSVYEERLLESPECPIVLLKRRRDTKVNLANSIAPGNPYLGIMLPYTPLHHLLLLSLKIPIVATSGNILDETIYIDDKEAFEKLGKIADCFLIHDRPIVRHVDDSIVRIVLDKEMILRRARGYSPMPITFPGTKNNERILAVGAHLKNSIALQVDSNILVSQYIGDLSNEKSFNTFVKVIDDFKKLYDFEPSEIVCDLHPEYISTSYSKTLNKPNKSIQHHFAHIASCKAENQVSGSSLGVAWDGTGYGYDGTIWGGEFFLSDDTAFSHVAQFKQFRLPGGEKAIKETSLTVLGILYEMYGPDIFSHTFPFQYFRNNEYDSEVIKTMLKKNINTPFTSSVGRLFDAVSSILGISQYSKFEGQSAMKLEFIIDSNERASYPFDLIEREKIIIDWREMIECIIKDKKGGLNVSNISSKFHNTLSQIILGISDLVREEKVVLSGGCFQNLYLMESTINLLEGNNHKVYVHQRIPTNDGGISLGQIVASQTKYVSNKLKFNRVYNNILETC